MLVAPFWHGLLPQAPTTVQWNVLYKVNENGPRCDPWGTPDSLTTVTKLEKTKQCLFNKV